MDTDTKIFLVLGVAFGVWQLWIFAQAAAMMANPEIKPGSIKYGIGPGLVSLGLFLLAVIA